MAGVSDNIEHYIKMLLRDVSQVNVGRNELAGRLGCSPSQINYVLTTRFTPDHGYYIESKRGGGGYIRIVRIDMDKSQYLQAVITQAIGEGLSEAGARRLLAVLAEKTILSLREARVMASAVSDQTLKVSPEERDGLRAGILKQMLLSLSCDMQGDK